MQIDDAGNSTTDSPTSATRRRYDWSAVRPTTAVVETVATRLGVDPVDLDPLITAVDPDALDRLHMHHDPGVAEGVETTFTYAGHVVTVLSSGLVSVTPTSAVA